MSTFRPTISVLIRAHNEAHYLGATLAVLNNQRLPVTEIIVVDAGSTDATVAIAREHGARVMQIAAGQFSYGYTLNLSADVARGQFLVILSAHATPCHNDWLGKLLAPFDDPKVAGAYCRLLPRPESPWLQRVNTRVYYDLLPTLFHGAAAFYHNTAAAVRRVVWEKAPFDEELPACEDSDWMRKVTARGYRVVFVHDAPVWHSHNESLAAFIRRERKHMQAWRTMLFGPPR